MKARLLTYRLVFVAGAALTTAYAISPALYQRSLNGVLFAIVVVVLLFALRVAEGAEIAVTMILDRDDEQLAGHAVSVDMGCVKSLRTSLDDFVTGRQLLVVTLVLVLGLVCTLLERAGFEAADQQGEPLWLSAILKWDRPEAYAFWFPVVAVLVFAQLPSKFAAQQRPMRFFSNPFTQLLITLSSGIGRGLGLGLLMNQLGAPEGPAEPSRLQLYEAAAAFGNGLGLDDIDIKIEINPKDGSVAYEGRFVMRAYGREPSARIPQDDFWDVDVIEPQLVVDALPTYCGLTTMLGPTITTSGPKGVHWDLAFAAPLKLHDQCVFHVRYRVAPGAMKSGAGDFDFYSYDFERFPAKQLSVTVTLKDTSSFALREASVKVEASLEQRVNESEKRRVERNIVALNSGYQYIVRFPLMGAKYKFRWQVGQRI